MNNKLTVLLAALFIIGGGILAYNLFQKDIEREESIEGLNDFNIEDTASIYKVKINEKDIGSLTIYRGSNDIWKIEGTEFRAQPYNANLILETAYQIQVKQNVSEQMREGVLKNLLVRNKTVEFYKKNEDVPFKTWIIGGGTQDHMGTFMLLEKLEDGKLVRSSEPYIMHKPGIYGTLETRFFSNEQLWRYSAVFESSRNEIKSIDVNVNPDIGKSFKIKLEDDKSTLYDENGQPVSNYNSNAVNHYINHFKNLHYESFENKFSDQQIDSVFSTPSQFKITLKRNDGSLRTAEIWYKKLPTAQVDENTGLENVYDISRALCRIDNSDELVNIQFLSWDKVLLSLKYFTTTNQPTFMEPSL